MVQFDAVQPGRPWWWWFERPSVTGEAERAVHRVVRDGAGTLWVDHPHGGVQVQAFAGWVPLGPVAAVPDGTKAWQKICDLETLLAGERRARQRDWGMWSGMVAKHDEAWLATEWQRRLRNAVNEWCACGGRGPDDAQCCPACQVYHAVLRQERRKP